MEWVENFLNEVGVEDTDEALAKFKSDYFPKNAVPKDEFNKRGDKIDELESELGTAKDQLENTNQQLEQLEEQAEGKEELQENLQEIKQEYESYKESEQQRINQIKIDSKLEKELLKSKANEDAVDLLKSDFDVEGLELDEEGNLKNFDDQLEQVREKRSSLFAVEKKTSDEPKVDMDSVEKLTVEQADKLSDEEYYQAKQEGKI